MLPMQLGPYRETKEVIRDDIKQVILSLSGINLSNKDVYMEKPRKILKQILFGSRLY